MILPRQDLDMIRQWFNAVKDLNPLYLSDSDYELAQAIERELSGPRIVFECPQCKGREVMEDAVLHVNTESFHTYGLLSCEDCGHEGFKFTEIVIKP